MSRHKSLGLVVPVLGVTLLVVGVQRFRSAPPQAAVDALSGQREELQGEIDALQGIDEVPSHTHSERLPTAIEVGRLATSLQDLARRCGVGHVALNTKRAKIEASAEEEDITALLPGFDDPSADAEATLRGVEALIPVTLTLEMRAAFPAVMRFLGQVELLDPVTRVRTLSMDDLPDGVAVSVQLEAYALPDVAGAPANLAEPPR